MGEIVNNSINYIKRNYPEIKIFERNKEIEFIGRFIIQAYYNDIVIDIAPKLKIIFPKSYPEKMPSVYDLYDKYKIPDHLLDDGALCVATEFDLYMQLNKSQSIEDYVDKFLIPYFISFQGLKDKDEYVYGDREHGANGIYQSIGDFFRVDSNRKKIIKELLDWSVKVKPFRKLFPDSVYRTKMINRYSEKIGNIRSVGILHLKRINTMIERQEIIKQYYEYYKATNNNLDINRVAGGFSPPAPTPPCMRIRTGRFTPWSKHKL